MVVFIFNEWVKLGQVACCSVISHVTENAISTWLYNFTSLCDAITWGDVPLSCHREGLGCVLRWTLQVMQGGKSVCSQKMGSVNKLGPPSNLSSSHILWSFPVDWIQPLGNKLVVPNLKEMKRNCSAYRRQWDLDFSEEVSSCSYATENILLQLSTWPVRNPPRFWRSQIRMYLVAKSGLISIVRNSLTMREEHMHQLFLPNSGCKSHRALLIWPNGQKKLLL